MCRREYYNVLFPDGSVEPKERTLHCNRGTPSSICPDLAYHEVGDRYATVEESATRNRHDVHPIAPRSEPESRGRHETPPPGLHFGFKWRNIFKKSDAKKEMFWERKVDKTKIKYRPRTPQPRTPSPEPRPASPIIIPIRPKPSKQKEKGPPKPKRRPSPVEIHHPKGKGPSSPLDPGREHHKPFSPIKTDAQRAYERDKEERRRQEQAREPQAAQDRAQRHHEKEMQRVQKEARARREQQQRRRSYDARADPGETDESIRARQRQHERDAEILLEADRRQAQVDREEALRAQEEEEQRRRRQEDKDRRHRQRDAGVPRTPRHSNTVHNNRNLEPQDFDEQGSEWIADATRTVEQRERYTAWDRPQRGVDGLWRRNTVDGSQREETNGRRKRSRKRKSRSD